MKITDPLPARPLQTAFVTGGSGFLGRNLIRALRRAHVVVHALARSEQFDLDGDAIDRAFGPYRDRFLSGDDRSPSATR